MANIKILVACHKPAELPHNQLFLPIQVGAALAKHKLLIQPDDEGDNISSKNPTYCELTAQYWAWKNLNADYYGLCHYRRFLCFRDVNDKRNYRNQIESSIMNAFNIEHFGLEDEAEMRRIIEENDIVVGEEQTVSRLYTPRGAKNTAYEHWTAHDRTLIKTTDLEKMLQILSEVSPEVGAAARQYLAGKTFLGFNCFVMKKPLFDQLCSIEFEVLSRLEQETNLKDYCQQLTRIYGFMGEIISSSFIYYLEQQGTYKIKRVPLVYFNYTEPLENFAPLYPLDADHIPLIFDYADGDPLRFGPIWRTFLDHINPDTFYDVLLISESEPAAQAALQSMAQDYPNVSLRFAPALPIREYMIEKYHVKRFTTRELEQRLKNPENDNWHIPVLPYLPFILTGYDRALIIDKNTLFCDDIAKLWRAHWQTEHLLAAPANGFIRSRINDIYYETLERHLDQNMQRPLNYFSTSTFVWNFTKYRTDIDESSIAKLYIIPEDTRQIRSKEEILNILCEGKNEEIDIRWSTWFDTDGLLKNQLAYMPLDLYQKTLAARQDPGVIVYLPNDPWDPLYSILTDKYWDAAKRTPFFNHSIQHGMALSIYRAKHHKQEVLTKAFPVDGKARSRLTKILPYGTKRHRAVKKALGFLHLR